MCWSHVERNCEENVRSYNSEIKEEILKDIKGIQVMPSKCAFNHAIDLFFEKWESHETQSVNF